MSDRRNLFGKPGEPFDWDAFDRHHAEIEAKAASRDNPIRVTFIRPPIPTKQFDWSAVRDDYEPGRPVGFGPTAEAAVRDLLETEAWEAEGKKR